MEAVENSIANFPRPVALLQAISPFQGEDEEDRLNPGAVLPGFLFADFQPADLSPLQMQALTVFASKPISG